MEKICIQCELVFAMDLMIKGKNEAIQSKDALLLIKDKIIRKQKRQIDKLNQQVLALTQLKLKFEFNPN